MSNVYRLKQGMGNRGVLHDQVVAVMIQYI